jgi:hypothetical protein
MRRLVLALSIVAAAGGVARAQGWLAFRGAMYKERSTRVRQPMIDATWETGGGGTVDAHFLIDEITSASPAAGSPNEFTERRYEIGLGYRRDLGWITPGGTLRYSTEQDYTSFFLVGTVELELEEKNTVLRFAAGGGHDSINNGIAVESGSIGTPRISETLNTLLGSATVTRLLGPELVGSATYDLVLLEGYQGNLYRAVTGGASPVPERVPETRWRHALSGSLRGFLCPTRTTMIGAVRLYADDWGILGITPELRVVQEIVPGLDVRGRVRVHAQGDADFYEDVYTAAEIMTADYVTDDEKLGAMRTILVGGQVVAALGLFGVEGRWAAARIEALFEYIDQDTSWGDAWNAQLGFGFPIGP